MNFCLVYFVSFITNSLKSRAQIFKLLRSPGIDYKELIPPAYVRYDNPIPTRFLDPIEHLKKIPDQYNTSHFKTQIVCQLLKSEHTWFKICFIRLLEQLKICYSTIEKQLLFTLIRITNKPTIKRSYVL
jgi:hypothetical protein